MIGRGGDYSGGFAPGSQELFEPREVAMRGGDSPLGRMPKAGEGKAAEPPEGVP